MTALAVVGEVALADSYCKQFGLDPSGLPLKGEALAQSCQARDAMFLSLSVPAENVHFVDSKEVIFDNTCLDTTYLVWLFDSALLCPVARRARLGWDWV